MSIHPDIRDQAYQFFIEEAPELLEILEAGLLTLREERDTARVHTLMRAAHSLKGSSASVGLDTIKDIAHRLESIFKAFYSDTVEIDTDLETLLLQAYDALKFPLVQQISTGSHNVDEAIAQSDAVFEQLEERLSDALERADDYLPSSSDLGVDMVASIFEVDVAQGIERLQQACNHPDSGVIVSEVEAQAEVFEGIAELLNLNGFGSIATTTRQALTQAPDQALRIAQLCLADFRAAREQVMAGKRSGEGNPCHELVAIATGRSPEQSAASASAASSETDAVSEEFDFDDSFLNESLSDMEAFDSLDQLSDLEDLDQLTDDISDGMFDASPPSAYSAASLTDSSFEDFDFDPTEVDSGDFNASDFAAALDEALQPQPRSPAAPTADSNQPIQEPPQAAMVDPSETELSDTDLPFDADLLAALPDSDWPAVEEAASSPKADSRSTSSTLDCSEGACDCQPQSSKSALAAPGPTQSSSSQSQQGTGRSPKSQAPRSQSPSSKPPSAQSSSAQSSGSEPPSSKSSASKSSASKSSASKPSASKSSASKSSASKSSASKSSASRSKSAGSRSPSLAAVPPPPPPSPLSAVNRKQLPFPAAQASPTSRKRETAAADLQELHRSFDSLPPIDEQSLPQSPQKKPVANPSLDVELAMGRQSPSAAAAHPAPNASDSSHPSAPQPASSQLASAPSAKSGRASSTSSASAPAASNSSASSEIKTPDAPSPPSATQAQHKSSSQDQHPKISTTTDIAQPAPSLSVRVSLDRLERMDNQVGELAINRNGLSLQQEQLQRAARDLTHRFSRFQSLVEHLREASDQVLISPSQQRLRPRHSPKGTPAPSTGMGITSGLGSSFDPLEMDQYSALYSQLQSMLEEVVQIEESVDDVVLFTGQSNRTLQDQRQMLNQLRHELMWARMLPLGEVLNRFPRVLRDLSTKFQKSVGLKLFGTSVLVDRAVLEKLYDPLLHLLRNAFDHGIETPERRQELGKPAQGIIEIRAYHQSNKTMIEIRDDGAGLSLQKIQRRALEQGLITADALAGASPSQIFELIFEPGFSTAQQVSEISGRGVGLDIVRSRLRSLQGAVTVTSEPGQGTTFTLCLPLTLTIAKLLVCSVGATAIALPSDSIEEIVVPKGNQVRQSANQHFLNWRDHIVPVHPLASLLDYNCPVQETSLSRALAAAPMPREWALPLLVLRREQHFVALEINRLVTEQELVIKPFSKAIAPPHYAYGCTILGDGTLLPVIDGYVLIDQVLGKSTVTTGATQFSPDFSKPIDLVVSDANSPPSSSKFKTLETPQILVVDDAATLRKTLALTLQRAGYRVIQARDGREAIEQLEQSQSVHLVICDIEMPNMNGFEFLNYRRQHNELTSIPVAMLTSRSNNKHRQLALHLGANAYFTKPYTEQDFLSSINSILSVSGEDETEVVRLTVANASF